MHTHTHTHTYTHTYHAQPHKAHVTPSPPLTLLQTFFTEEFGLPLTMKPNFEDLSCEMIFGQVGAGGERQGLTQLVDDKTG
jgi:hypothetical protein